MWLALYLVAGKQRSTKTKIQTLIFLTCVGIYNLIQIHFHNGDKTELLNLFRVFSLFLSGSDVLSHEKDSEGHPLLQLSPPTLYVRSFSQVSKLVHLADDKKLEEVRACLEGKHDDHRMRFASNLNPK